jgi:hypothetical protein
MTNDQAIRAGALALQRNTVRKAVTENRLAEVSLVINGKRETLHLDAGTTRAVLDALDFNLSERLGKYGVAEL